MNPRYIVKQLLIAASAVCLCFGCSDRTDNQDAIDQHLRQDRDVAAQRTEKLKQQALAAFDKQIGDYNSLCDKYKYSIKTSMDITAENTKHIGQPWQTPESINDDSNAQTSAFNRQMEYLGQVRSISSRIHTDPLFAANYRDGEVVISADTYDICYIVKR